MEKCKKEERKMPRPNARGPLDLRGMQFGWLTAKEPTRLRATDGSVVWACQCRCGGIALVSSNRLRMGHTTSCGCAARRALAESRTFVGGTCVEIMMSGTVNRNNTSGFRGVCRKRNGWQAYITFQGRSHALGTFREKSDAVDARLRAEAAAREQIARMLDCGD